MLLKMPPHHAVSARIIIPVDSWHQRTIITLKVTVSFKDRISQSVMKKDILIADYDYNIVIGMFCLKLETYGMMNRNCSLKQATAQIRHLHAYGERYKPRKGDHINSNCAEQYMQTTDKESKQITMKMTSSNNKCKTMSRWLL